MLRSDQPDNASLPACLGQIMPRDKLASLSNTVEVTGQVDILRALLERLTDAVCYAA
jgi:hypothetical protein